MGAVYFKVSRDPKSDLAHFFFSIVYSLMRNTC
jgi:hypothetical protein